MPDSRQILASTPPFSAFPALLLDRLAAAAETQSLADGAVLFSAGDAADALYVVAEGTLREVQPDTPERLIAELRPNMLAGEVQILTGGTHVTTVRAVGGARVVRLARHAIDTLTADDRQAAAGLNA